MTGDRPLRKIGKPETFGGRLTGEYAVVRPYRWFTGLTRPGVRGGLGAAAVLNRTPKVRVGARVEAPRDASVAQPEMAKAASIAPDGGVKGRSPGVGTR